MTFASCLMLTYNKAPKSLVLVEEAIESFLRQDWPDKELIVLNDTPGQTLSIRHSLPGVHIINLPRRAASLGEKVNIAAALAKGDIMFRWDDDDIHLPWRISVSLAQRGDAAYWKPARSWWNCRSEMKLMAGFFGACCFTRQAFDAIGGYPHIGVGEDQAFELAFTNHKLPVVIGQIQDRDAFYLYRWATGSNHVSGLGADGYRLTGQHPVAKGDFPLQPRWQRDYVDFAIQSLDQQRRRQPVVNPHNRLIRRQIVRRTGR